MDAKLQKFVRAVNALARRLLVGGFVVGMVVGGTGVAWARETVTYYHLDALGSPIAATDAQGNVKWREDYQPYGSRLLNQDAASDNDRWYTGHPFDEAFGLTYTGARYYDPIVGRFMGVDPKGVDAGDVHSFNRYAYADNNPYRYVDPDGANATTALGGLAYESYQALTGNGFNGAMVLGALVDGYNGEGAGIWRSALEDAINFGGVEAVGVGATRLAVRVGRKLLTRAVEAGSDVGEVTKGDVPPIKWGAQEKHFPGHNSYTPGRSTMTSDPTKLAEKAGTGQQVGKVPVGQPGSKERVNFGETIGTYIDQAGNASPTTNGIIHYSKDGIHIVPARP